MYKDRRIIALIPAYNEARRAPLVVRRCAAAPFDAVLVIDDGSTDETAALVRASGAEVISLPRRSGVGAALRAGLEYARAAQFEIAVILAGNDKDDPAEVSRLLDPICDDRADFVIGSRYLEGGRFLGAPPRYRRWATRLHPWLMSWFSGRRLTETTNGFRALDLSILDDRRFNLNQRWLESYGLEVYLLWKVLTLGYRHHEVPCTKTYPPPGDGYTKMIPVFGWWSILKPIFLLGLRLRA